MVGVGVGVLVGLTVGVPVPLGVGLTVGVAVALAVGVGDPEPEGGGVELGVGVVHEVAEGSHVSTPAQVLHGALGTKIRSVLVSPRPPSCRSVVTTTSPLQPIGKSLNSKVK